MSTYPAATLSQTGPDRGRSRIYDYSGRPNWAGRARCVLLFAIDHVGAILLNATCRKKDRGPREDIYLLYRESGALRENGEENHGSVKHVFVTVFDETIVPRLRATSIEKILLP